MNSCVGLIYQAAESCMSGPLGNNNKENKNPLHAPTPNPTPRRAPTSLWTSLGPPRTLDDMGRSREIHRVLFNTFHARPNWWAIKPRHGLTLFQREGKCTLANLAEHASRAAQVFCGHVASKQDVLIAATAHKHGSTMFRDGSSKSEGLCTTIKVCKIVRTP